MIEAKKAEKEEEKEEEGEEEEDEDEEKQEGLADSGRSIGVSSVP